MNKEREILAWAAGFFDGEGCTTLQKTKAGGKYPVIAVVQKDPQLLEKFNQAIGDIGKIYVRKNGVHTLRIFSYTKVKIAIDLLWPWLGEVKKAQAKRVFSQSNYKKKK
jgi:hypothetical protein